MKPHDLKKKKQKNSAEDKTVRFSNGLAYSAEWQTRGEPLKTSNEKWARLDIQSGEHHSAEGSYSSPNKQP